MADDWIKMRAALVDHPKVIAMSRALQADNDFRHWLTPGGAPGAVQIVSNRALRCVTTALLMCVWSVARATGKFDGDDLFLPHSNVVDLDEIAGAPGVGAAMVALGWVKELPRNGGLFLPNFVEFNVPKTSAERQHEYRERQKEALRNRSNENGENVTTRGREEITELPNGSSVLGTQDDKPTRKRGRRLPTDWKLTRAMVEWAQAECPDIDPQFEARQFFDYWQAASGRNATKLDWTAAYRTWCRKSQQDRNPGGPGGGTRFRLAPHQQPSRQGQAIAGLLGGRTSNTEDFHHEPDSLVLESDP